MALNAPNFDDRFQQGANLGNPDPGKLNPGKRSERDAVEIDSSVPEQLREQCRGWERMRRLDEALQGWRQLEQSLPDDEEVAAAIVRLVIRRNRQQHGQLADIDQLDAVDWPGFSTPPPTKPFSPPIGLDSHPKALPAIEPMDSGEHVGLTPIQKLQAQSREHPGDADLRLQLALMYLEKGRDFDAEQLLTKAREQSQDARIQVLWEDVTMNRFAKKIQATRERFATETTESAKRELADLLERRDRFELQVFQQRCELEPNNTGLRFELALRWKQIGKIREALQCLEEVLPDSDFRPAAALELAEIFVARTEHDKAFRYYRMAIDSAVYPQQLAVKTRALFRSATLALRFKLLATARGHVERLMRIAPTYAEAEELLRGIDSAANRAQPTRI